MNEVKILKLITGEEVICFAEVTEDGWNVKHPGYLIPTEKGIGISPMMPYTTIDESNTFLKNSIVMLALDPVKGLEDQYRSIYQKIITPDKKIIT